MAMLINQQDYLESKFGSFGQYFQLCRYENIYRPAQFKDQLCLNFVKNKEPLENTAQINVVWSSALKCMLYGDIVHSGFYTNYGRSIE